MQTIESPTETIEQPSRELTQARTHTSSSGRYLDIALVVAVVGPPALIGLLMLLGLGFALAVCVVFAAVFVLTTAEDVTWSWQRRIDRENQWDLD
jgi:hypothetical protein